MAVYEIYFVYGYGYFLIEVFRFKKLFEGGTGCLASCSFEPPDLSEGRGESKANALYSSNTSALSRGVHPHHSRRKRPDMQYETEINKALRSLKNQNISVSSAIVGPHGHAFDVMGYMLTAAQIVQLKNENNLNAQGIRAFAKKFEPAAKK